MGDLANGNEWLTSFIRYSQELGYKWVKTSELFWYYKKYLFDPTPDEFRVDVAGSVLPRLVMQGRQLYYDLRTYNASDLTARSELFDFALIASNATILNATVTGNAAVLRVRNVVNVKPVINLYSSCQIGAVYGAKSWSQTAGDIELSVSDPSDRATQSEVSIYCVGATLPTSTKTLERLASSTKTVQPLASPTEIVQPLASTGTSILFLIVVAPVIAAAVEVIRRYRKRR
jgi:hypothetical protein